VSHQGFVTWRAAALLVVVLGAAVACSADEAASPDLGPSTADAESERTEVAQASDFADPTGSGPTAEPIEEDYRLALSPIERALGLPDDPFEISETLTAHQLAVAEDTTACMAVQGFDGFVEVPELTPEANDLADFSSTEAVASFGYGPAITLRSMLDQLTGSAERLATDADAVPTDERNWENFDPITAYLEANPQIDEDDFYGHYADCFDRARVDRPPPQIEVPEVVAAEVAAVRSQAAETPVVVEAWDDWSRCLAEEGHRFITRVTVRAAMETEGDPIRIEIVGHLQNGTVPDDADLAELERRVEELADLERVVASADVACAQATGLDETLLAERDRVEQAWLDANEDRITLLLAEAATAPAGQEGVDPRSEPADG